MSVWKKKVARLGLDFRLNRYEILAILKSVLSPKKYYHCTAEENQPEYLYYGREEMLFASCQTLKDNGLCPSEECTGQWLYL